VRKNREIKIADLFFKKNCGFESFQKKIAGFIKIGRANIYLNLLLKKVNS